MNTHIPTMSTEEQFQYLFRIFIGAKERASTVRDELFTFAKANPKLSGKAKRAAFELGTLYDRKMRAWFVVFQAEHRKWATASELHKQWWEAQVRKDLQSSYTALNTFISVIDRAEVIMKS